MKGRVAGVSAGLILVAVVLAFGAPTASAACPNEAFRTGLSALLPECRAYEMVTPVDKESGEGIAEHGGSHVSPSGDAIYFNALSAFSGAQGNAYYDPYIATRGGDGWGTLAIGGPQASQVQTTITTTYAVTDDLALSFMASKEALAPGAIPYGSNLYVRDNRTGAYTTVAALPGDLAFNEWGASSQFNLPFVDAAADWSNILVFSVFALTPDAVEGEPNLYEFTEGRLRLAVAGARPGGENGLGVVSEAAPNVMSSDGSRFFYNVGGTIYMHRRGQEAPVPVSEAGEGNPAETAVFVGAAPNGDVAFFQTYSGLYRFEAGAPPGHRLTRLMPELGLDGYPTHVTAALTNEAGTYVYFSTTSRLTEDTRPHEGAGENYLYVWHGEPGQAGQIRYIGEADLREYPSLSPDGRFLAFEESGKVTPDVVPGTAESCPPAGRCTNVFLYSYDSDRLDCASCTGGPPAGYSQVGESRRRDELSSIPRTVLDDGTVFFNSPNALVPGDANGVGDVYAWRDGHAQLISSGTDRSPSAFINASASGSDVFFATEQSLVGQDQDRILDLYDARVDGGLPQGLPVAAPSCIAGNDCRGEASPGTPTAAPGSGSFHGSGNVAADACRPLLGKVRSAVRRSRTLRRRARDAKGHRAGALRKKAGREAKTARRLEREADDCRGGGR